MKHKVKKMAIRKPRSNGDGNTSLKQLGTPFSTGGGGSYFEAKVQAAYLALMLTGGNAPALPTWNISKIKLQGKFDEYQTDDLVIFVEKPGGGQTKKMLAQIKHSVEITKGNKTFGEIINAAWADFNNPNVFTKNQDIIALVTGPLSVSDIADVRTVLEWVRECENSEEFIKKTNRAKFISRRKKKKLDAFRSKLKESNGNKDVSDDDFFQFLKHFHLLGYDLDVLAGVTLSLLHSHIGQFSKEDVKKIWACLVDKVQNANQNAGTITLDNLPDDLKEIFQKKISQTFPPELAKNRSLSKETAPLEKPDWNITTGAAELAIANLVGAWNENSDADKSVVNLLAIPSYDAWILKIREILLWPESPISIKRGILSLSERMDLWSSLGSRIFDPSLDTFYKVALEVLKERDPQFELPPGERYIAGMRGKVLKYSRNIRKGFAESLALLGSRPEALTSCTVNKPRTTASRVVFGLLHDADWVLWGSLNDVLPLLAEAAPDEFLNAVETSLCHSPSPFDELYAQERGGFGGRTYITGLLWALETLAWEERYLTPATVILGELAARDPGGNWGNRPSHSLTEIFLPWLPQTLASVDKRKVAIQTLSKQVPEVAWKLLLALLPNQTQASSGAQKPKWRKTIPSNPTKINNAEYWEQSLSYAAMAVDMAKGDIAKLSELIPNLENLPKESFDGILEYLQSDELKRKPELDKLILWNKLIEFCARHKQFPEAEWTLGSELVSKVENAAKQLEPKSIFDLNKRLFSGRDYDLVDEKKEWKEQQEELEGKRRNVLAEILKKTGIDSVIKYAKLVESPSNVGFSLGSLGDAAVDAFVLPKLLTDEDKKIAQFVGGYIWGRYKNGNWTWVDALDKSDWNRSQVARFLINLPFGKEAWQRVEVLLKEYRGEYWKEVNVNPYQADGDFNNAIDRLCEFGRPLAALHCIHKKMCSDKNLLDTNRAVKVLLLVGSTEEPKTSMDRYYIEELIQALQKNPKTNPNDLFAVEWMYLALLDRPGSILAPKTLERRLAEKPEFFCEAIRLIYRSKKEAKIKRELSPAEQAAAANAYSMLSSWRIPPGLKEDGSFSENEFKDWMKEVVAACSESGHLEVALISIGHMLIHSPEDPSGLWIHHVIAEVLNSKDFEDMRRGFSTATFNARGVHMIDPSGKSEYEIAARHRKRAEDVENAGFQRLAATLRGLADSYDAEAKRIIDEHGKELD